MYMRGLVNRVGGDHGEMYVEVEEQGTRRIWNFISYPHQGHQIVDFLDPGSVYVFDYQTRGSPPEYDGVITGVRVPNA